MPILLIYGRIGKGIETRLCVKYVFVENRVDLLLFMYSKEKRLYH